MWKRVILLLCCTLTCRSFANRPYFDEEKDILLAQFDSNRDPDDIHAIAALGSLLASPKYASVKCLAVHGAYGIQPFENFIESPKLFQLIFGEENKGWVNASPQKPNWNGAIKKIATTVEPILKNGGKVWVAEAGQSDITADWIRALLKREVPKNLIKTNVIVVQHSDWNENSTTEKDLKYVKKMADYRVINDGNGANTRRDPNGPSTPNYRSNNQKFQKLALNSKNKKVQAYWKEAEWVINDEGHFPKHSSITTGGVDFSDVVEVHWILNSPEEFDTIQKFWDLFITPVPEENSEPEFPTNRKYQTKSETASNAMWIEENGFVVMEAENAAVATDWKKFDKNDLTDPTMVDSTGDGWIEWQGDQNYQTTIKDKLAKGITVYRFKITTPGEYTFYWRSKQHKSAEKSDAGNDTYVKFATGKPIQMRGTKGNAYLLKDFTKVWVQNKNQWSWVTQFEPTHGEFIRSPQVKYDAGIHEIWIAGRSKGHAIDKILLNHSPTTLKNAQIAPESELVKN